MFSRFPVLRQLQAGMRPNTTRTDAIGRAVFRVDEEPHNAGDYRPDDQGGMPRARGPETNIPALQEAARRLGMDPAVAVQQPVLQQTQVPNRPGGMFNLARQEYDALAPETGGRRPNDPILQAMAGLRKARATGQLQ